MKVFIGLIMVLVLAACGRDGKDGSDGATGPMGPAGTNGTDGSNGKDGKDGKNGEDGEDLTPEEEASLAGYHLLPDGGYIELLEDNDGRIIINGTQRIYTRNANDSLGMFVTMATGPYTPHDSKIRAEANMTYVAATHNIQVDGSATQIVGARKTVTTFSLNSAGKLVIKVLVYSSTGLSIEVTRTITGE